MSCLPSNIAAKTGAAFARQVRPIFRTLGQAFRPSVPCARSSSHSSPASALRLSVPHGHQFVGVGIAWSAAAKLLGGRLPTISPPSLLQQRKQQQHQQLRGLADAGEKRWDGEGDVAEVETSANSPSDRWRQEEESSAYMAALSHPHGLKVSVVNGNVDLALKKLRRKVIIEGVMKKYRALKVFFLQ